MNSIRPNKQALEVRVLSSAEFNNVPLEFTPGSGNVRGDGDLRMPFNLELPVRVGFECKDSPSGVRKNHTVPWKEWEKAQQQIVRSSDTVAAFVTGVQGKGDMVHMALDDFMNLLGIIYEPK